MKFSTNDRMTIQPIDDARWGLSDVEYGFGHGVKLDIWQPIEKYSKTKLHCLLRHKTERDMWKIVMSEYDDFFEFDTSEKWDEWELVYDFVAKVNNREMGYDFIKTNKEETS